MPVVSRGDFLDPHDGRLRLALSSRAPALLRLHVNRNLFRVATLMLVDLATLMLLNALLTQLLPVQDHVPLREYAAAMIFGLALLGCYRRGDEWRNPGSIARAAGLGASLALWSLLWQSTPGGALALLGGVWLVTTVAFVLMRRALDRVVRLIQPTPTHVMRAVVIGSPEQAVELIDHPAVGETPWCHLVSSFDPSQSAPGELSGDLARLIRAHRVDTVVLAAHLDGSAFATVLDAAITAGCQALSFPRVPPTPTHSARLVWRDGVALVEHTRPAMIGAERFIKRLLDATGAMLALLLLSPLMAIIAVLIRRESSGPVFFRQVRIGQGGRTFRIVKFRTMVANAEAQRSALQGDSLYPDARLFKVPADPRITRLGAILRRTSLDELPQFWNVLRGEMSLVGPRPPLPTEVDLYQASDFARFDVKPGITGPWQVSGRNEICDFDEVVRLETAYIRRWSIWLDFGLLLRTVPAVLSGRGAH
jgi:exopolysaccharide biosynthesis polyprenyl glycosylphosphotransferase